MKRFYKDVSVVADDESFSIALDGRPVRTPGRALLQVPTPALADCIAAEWRAQEEEVRPAAMPMTRFANSAIDRIRPRRPEVVSEIAAYAETDLLCYRADTPEELIERQAFTWQPLLDWTAERYNAPLRVTQSVTPVAQDDTAVAALREEIAALDEFALSGVHSLTAVSGSIVLALAVVECRISAAEAAAASLLDETFQAERWGEDPEAVVRWESIGVEMASAARFLATALPKLP